LLKSDDSRRIRSNLVFLVVAIVIEDAEDDDDDKDVWVVRTRGGGRPGADFDVDGSGLVVEFHVVQGGEKNSTGFACSAENAGSACSAEDGGSTGFGEAGG
jgi:hypothetical protein